MTVAELTHLLPLLTSGWISISISRLCTFRVFHNYSAILWKVIQEVMSHNCGGVMDVSGMHRAVAVVVLG
jgi:hypothetical protein